MAVIMSKIFVLPGSGSDTYTVTITGTGTLNSGYVLASATVDGVEYTSATKLNVPSGTTISLYISCVEIDAEDGEASAITVDGAVVRNIVEDERATYDMTVDSDLIITLSANDEIGRYGSIDVTSAGN